MFVRQGACAISSTKLERRVGRHPTMAFAKRRRTIYPARAASGDCGGFDRLTPAALLACIHKPKPRVPDKRVVSLRLWQLHVESRKSPGQNAASVDDTTATC